MPNDINLCQKYFTFLFALLDSDTVKSNSRTANSQCATLRDNFACVNKYKTFITYLDGMSARLYLLLPTKLQYNIFLICKYFTSVSPLKKTPQDTSNSQCEHGENIFVKIILEWKEIHIFMWGSYMWPSTTKGTWCRPGLFWDNEQNSVQNIKENVDFVKVI